MTAFVRGDSHPAGARVVRGDATDGAAVARAVAGHDAVVSTLGVRKPGATSLQARAMQALVPAMEKAGARRLVVMSALGVGDTRASTPFLSRLLHALLLRGIFADKAAGERIVAASALDWTIVYPGLLTNGPRTGIYRAGETLALGGYPRIARADVADFMVRALATGEWSRKRVIVSP